MLFTDIEKSKITMLEFGSKQNMTDMDTKRVRGRLNASLTRWFVSFAEFSCIYKYKVIVESFLECNVKYLITTDIKKFKSEVLRGSR